MGGSIDRNTTLPDSSAKADFHNLVDTATLDLTAPGAIGGTTPGAGTFTTLIGTNIDGIIGANTPAAGAFTTITGDGSALTDIDAVKKDGTVNPTNLLSNGDFESWSSGTAVAPDGWTFAGASATIARSATHKLGTYSAAITRSGTDCYLYNRYDEEKGIAYWKGRTVTLGCWCYATVADRARIRLTEGGTGTTVYSDYHTGDSTWQWLAITQTVSSSATNLVAYLFLDTGDTTAYFDGAMLVEGSSAYAFSPKPPEEGVWADYFATSTIVGWAASPTGYIYTKKVGNLVFVSFRISGTSNTTSVSFTLPYVASAQYFGGVLTYVVDNSEALSTAAKAEMNGSRTVGCYKTMASGGWTASGTKSVYGNFWYEVQ